MSQRKLRIRDDCFLQERQGRARIQHAQLGYSFGVKACAFGSSRIARLDSLGVHGGHFSDAQPDPKIRADARNQVKEIYLAASLSNGSDGFAGCRVLQVRIHTKLSSGNLSQSGKASYENQVAAN